MLVLPWLLFPAAGLMLWAEHKVVVGVAGAVAAASMIWTSVFIQRSRHVDRLTKRSVAGTWFLVVIIVGLTIAKLLR